MKGTAAARNGLTGVIWRLSIFVAVSMVFVFAMFAVFGQLRFSRETLYSADFVNVSGLEAGQFVRIAGVQVGKVKDIVLQRDSTVSVRFSLDDTVILTQDSKAIVRYADLVGGRYVALEKGSGDGARLKPGDTIALANTSPPLDLDALIGGFRPLFRALEPDQVNALSSQLINSLQGEGDSINAFFEQTAALTNVLADRDQLIGQVVTNLSAVLSSLGDENTQFAKAVDSLAELLSTLADRKQDLGQAVASANSAAGSIADLMTNIRPPLVDVVRETDRTAAIVVADHDYVDNLLGQLPSAYQMLARQSIYGDYFGFYLCQIVFKVNGKGGQPIYIKAAGQASGRCTPR